MSKKNSWFKNYQQIGNIKGQRDIDYRKKFLKSEDFSGNSVIDIGCNMGQLCRYSKELGATNVLGVDYDVDVIKKAETLNTYDDVLFQTDDIDNYLFYTDLKNFDVCLILSVIGTEELNNKGGILAKLSQKTNKVMYIEGHHYVMKYAQLLNMILQNTTFSSIEYLGESYDNISYEQQNKSRSIFRCSRDTLNIERFLIKMSDILNCDGNKINLINGHACTGKSYIKNKLIEHLNNNGYNMTLVYTNNREKTIHVDELKNVVILDDIPTEELGKYVTEYEKIIVFDYEAIEYLKKHKIDNIFYVKQNLVKRQQCKPDYKYNRSVKLHIENDMFIENIYHIDNLT